MLRASYGMACLACLTGIFLITACRSESDSPNLDADSVELPISADGQNKTGRLPKMVFDKELHDFGIIKAGEKVSYSFRFVNRGGGDLIIQSASGSCGCTVPDFPKEPIPPGREGYIRVMFNSEGKSGIQEKQVTVLANTLPNTITVRVKAEIVQP
ncbi:MAG: hypothetical protein RLZZ121_23 [Bacteroidota bacterium]